LEVKWRILISVLISSFFLWLAAKDVNFVVVLESLGRFNYLMFFFALSLWIGGYMIRGLRWQILLKDMNHVSWRSSFKVLISGFAMNNVLPMRMGEFGRAYLMNRVDPKVPAGAAFATIAIERVFDGFCVVGYTFLGTLGLDIPDWVRNAEILAILIFVVAFAVFIYLVNYPTQIRALHNVIIHFLPQKWANWLIGVIENFITGLAILRSLKGTVAVFIYTLLAWTIEVFFYYLSAKSFGIDINLIHAAFLMGILNLGVMIPAGPGGVGAFEFIAVKALALFGVGSSLAFSYGVVSHFLQNGSVILLGAYFLGRIGIGEYIQIISSKRKKVNIQSS
jgi:glycosyltransferase 2 family protein